MEIFDLPIRYYSIVPLAKEFQSRVDLPDGEAIELSTVLSSLTEAKQTLSGVTPYLFLLLETESAGAYWQYLDLAGELSKIHYTDEASHAICDKVVFPNGTYMYQVKEIYLSRTK